MKRWHFRSSLAALLTTAALLASCSTLDEKQRAWIFQPSDRSWSGGAMAAVGMDDVWIDFSPREGRQSDKNVRLHGLWLASDQPTSPDTPVLLYLHGARYNVTGSAPRMRRMQELGFSVLGIDYRGFGKSTALLPSETSAYEDARAAWNWLAKKYPDNPRYIFGHSLGGSIAINLASEVLDERGTIVEGTFTSIADVVSSSEWGWVPLSMLITQRFEAVSKVKTIGSPLLVVHGDKDRLILPNLGKKLFEAAAEPKRFLLVKGGSHHDTNLIGQSQYRTALDDLMNIPALAKGGPLEEIDKSVSSSGSKTSPGSVKKHEKSSQPRALTMAAGPSSRSSAPEATSALNDVPSTSNGDISSRKTQLK